MTAEPGKLGGNGAAEGTESDDHKAAAFSIHQ
jgi:hypothetical protein